MLIYCFIMKIIYFFTFVITFVSANSHCSSNAWLKWHVSSHENNQDCGWVEITSGKDSQTISTVTAMRAISDCAFNNYGCTGTWLNDYWRFCCNSGGMKWVDGTGNVEFNCSDGPYTCYNFNKA